MMPSVLQLRTQVPALLRVVRWQPVGFLAAAAVVALAVSTGWRAEPPEFRPAVWTVRLVAVLLALGAGFLLDDAAGSLTASVPMPLVQRVGVRVLLLAALFGPLWAVILLVVRARVPNLPVGGITLEFVTMVALALALAVAAIAARLGLPEPGLIAGAAVAAGAMLAFVVGQRFILLSLRPQDWMLAHTRWAAVLAACLLVTATALRDPARRPFPRRRSEASRSGLR